MKGKRGPARQHYGCQNCGRVGARADRIENFVYNPKKEHILPIFSLKKDFLSIIL